LLAGLPVVAADTFSPGKATDYPSVQVTGKVRIAAVKYESDAETKPVFAKTNPNEYGILPILLLVENQSLETVMVDRMYVSYQTPDRMQIEPMDSREILSVRAPKRPGTGGVSYPSPIPLPKKKNPLTKVEFETRAWAAKTLMPGESAHGFLYFNVRHRRNAILYITGIREGSKELFFVEVPIDTPDQRGAAKPVNP
jgi:hypothetical protein